MSRFANLFSRRPAEPTTKIFFSSDFHGSSRTFRKFLNAGPMYGASVLIVGGDLIGKLAVPIIRESATRYRAHLMGKTETLDGADALKAFEARLETLGYYGRVMDEEQYRAIRGDEAAVEALFQELALARLREWISVAEERLARSGMRCFVIGGNDDFPEVLETLTRETTERVIFCEGREVAIDEDHTMVSAGFSTPTPWHTPRELPDEQLGEMLEAMIAPVACKSRCVFNLHVPPADSTLDTCPELDWTTDPPSQIVKGGQVVLHGAGSRSVRRAIETHQPLLSLHGHIHESGGATHIGRTVSINPGSEYGEGILRGCLVTLGRDEVKSLQMTAG